MFGFILEQTEEPVTAHGGLALLAGFNHGLGVCGLTDRYLPGPGANHGCAPSVFVDRLILMLQAWAAASMISGSCDVKRG